MIIMESLTDYKTPIQEYRKKFKITKVKFALSETQRKELLEKAKSRNHKHYIMIYTQLHTGLRVSEVVHLLIQYVNFNEKYIMIKGRRNLDGIDDWHPKTPSSNRIVPITDEIIQLLKEYIGDRTEGYLFLSNKIRYGSKSRYSRNSVISFINLYAKQCKSLGKTIGSHSLRRTYASYIANKNIPIGKLSQLLGHTSIKTTMEYLYSFVDMDFTDVRSVLDTMVE